MTTTPDNDNAITVSTIAEGLNKGILEVTNGVPIPFVLIIGTPNAEFGGFAANVPPDLAREMMAAAAERIKEIYFSAPVVTH